MDAFETIRSYSAEAERVLREAKDQAGVGLYGGWRRLPYEVFFDCVPAEHIQFFESLRLYHRTADCVCTHGGVDPGVDDIDRQTRAAHETKRRCELPEIVDGSTKTKGI